jgi:hypothetical protein
MKIFCYECGRDGRYGFHVVQGRVQFRWVCESCEPKLCRNVDGPCWATAMEEGGLCEGCDEIGFVRDGEFILFEEADDADAGHDMSADAEWLASAGWGTDEDYGG